MMQVYLIILYSTIFLDTERNLNVYKTHRRLPGRLMNEVPSIYVVCPGDCYANLHTSLHFAFLYNYHDSCLSASRMTSILVNFISSIIILVFFIQHMNLEPMFITVKGFPKTRNQPVFGF